MFCLLVVLVKLSTLAKWLAIKTPPRKPIRGKIISTKPRPKSARLFRFTVTVSLLHCALSLAAQCIVIGPVCLFVGLLPQLEIACIDLHQTGSVGEGSDHLQLIKF